MEKSVGENSGDFPDNSDAIGEQIWQLAKISNRLKSLTLRFSKILSGPKKRFTMVTMALALMYNESPTLFIDLDGLCHVSGVGPQHHDAVRKLLSKRNLKRLVETRPLDVVISPEGPRQESLQSSNGLICRNAMIIVSARRYGKVRNMYRWKPEAIDLTAVSKLPFVIYPDQEFKRRISTSESRETARATLVDLIDTRNRLLKLMVQCGILDKTEVQELDSKKVLDRLEGTAIKEDVSEDQLKLEAEIESRSLLLMSKLSHPKCPKCGKPIDHLELKRKGLTECRECHLIVYGYRCVGCQSLLPIPGDGSTTEIVCEVCHGRSEIEWKRWKRDELSKPNEEPEI